MESFITSHEKRESHDVHPEALIWDKAVEYSKKLVATDNAINLYLHSQGVEVYQSQWSATNK